MVKETKKESEVRPYYLKRRKEKTVKYQPGGRGKWRGGKGGPNDVGIRAGERKWQSKVTI